MKQITKLKNLVSGLTLSGVVLAGGAASAYIAPAAVAQSAPTPPARQLVSGPQVQPSVKPGTRDAKLTAPLGATKLVQTDASGAVKAQIGAVSSVDFQAHLKYCWKNLVYTPVKNSTTVTKYVQVRLYNQTGYRDIYTSVAAGSVAYPAHYGVDGTYSAYLYVWNGSSYQYDEYLGGTNTCNVSVTRVYNTGGWVQLKIQNLGTAYASQLSSELAPYPASGTYTGAHYDYPVAGGAAIYRWFQVGTQPYGIVSSTYGSFNSPVVFSGDL